MITDYMKIVTAFLEERELLISPEKSTLTLSTPDTKETRASPVVKINDKVIKTDPAPKVLGVTSNSMNTFTKHIKITIIKCNSKLHVLKSLAGTSWGQDKETMVITYKSVCQSILEYATQFNPE